MWWLLCAVLAAAVFFTLNNKKALKTPVTRSQKSPKRAGVSPAEKAPANPYHAISVCCEEHACAAAMANQSKRYLVGDVPSLPLEGCSVARCACRYQHHDDRREQELDRRLNFGLSQQMHDDDRRERCERRKK
ncbi:hypothetical protein [Dasania marina]|uniref:hypothetical protein n=1 Tax=Dasania marina TaxID=471499 RepID=UPI0030D8F2D6|tara:strand:- start:51291 stop:51689 length:399 start_codon:yes stop_codon:yes gene_type:complete